MVIEEQNHGKEPVVSPTITTSLTRGGTGLFSRVAADHNASEEYVVNGFRAAMRAIIGGMVNKGVDPDGLSLMFALVTTATVASHPPPAGNSRGSSSLGADGRSEQGESLLSMLFGRDRSSVAEEISRQALLPTDVSAQILALAAPMVLATLGRQVQEQGISLPSFPDLLLRQAEDVSKYVPSPIHSLQRAASTTSMRSQAGSPSVRDHRSHWGGLARFFLAAAVVTGIALLSWKFYSRYAADSERKEAIGLAQARFPAYGRFVERGLPNGARLIIPELGMESKLISYLDGSTQSADGEEWFDLDRLTFNANSAIPQPESDDQLMNLASILKAYPQVRLKVGGYTDNKGNRAASQRLAENRAQVVRGQLLSLGIASGRLEAEGYGNQEAIRGHTTLGQAKIRSVAVKILQR